MCPKIEYSFACICGRKRKKNEDNYYINGAYAEKEHSNADVGAGSILMDDASHEHASFGVFDGMGGEEDGEVASYMAAKSMSILDDQIGRLRKSIEDSNDDINICEEKIICHLRNVSDDIMDYCREKNYHAVGTTAAGIIFKGRHCYMYNIGDSRIYRIREDKMEQISVDHSIHSFLCSNGALTQFLGVDSKEFIIDPHIVSDSIMAGDSYIICSDGVTNMMENDALKEITDGSASTTEAVGEIIKKVNENGAKDNATVILIRIIADVKRG